VSSNTKKEIVVHKAGNLTLKFPDNDNEYIRKEVEKTKRIIKNDGVYTPDGRAFINKKSIRHLLTTDSKAVTRIYNDLDNKDKLENGLEKYISVEATQKELSKKIQEPIDTNKKDKLRYNEKAVIVLRDAPELEKKREQLESHIRKELPKVKAKKRKAENIDCITKEPLSSPVVHHIERIADNPRKALDEDNLAVMNKDTHTKIHKEDADTKEGFEQFKKKYNLYENES